MGNDEPEFCWAKTVRGQSPNRFLHNSTKFHHRFAGFLLAMYFNELRIW